MVAGLEENKRQEFTVNSIQGWELTTTKFECGNLVYGILEVMWGWWKSTGIWKGPETYQQEFVGVMGCNRLKQWTQFSSSKELGIPARVFPCVSFDVALSAFTERICRDDKLNT